MNNKMNSSILSPSGRLFLACLAAMTILAAPVQAQYVTTVVSNVLTSPYGVTTDPNNNAYVADTANNRIVMYNPSTKAVSTLAGLSGTFGSNNGAGALARFNEPQGIVYARGGLVVVDQANQLLRFVTLPGGAVTTLATTGAQLSYPKGIAVANDGATLYVADQGNNVIRVVSTNNVISTLASNYTYNAVTYPFRSPAAVAVDNNSNIWTADSLDHVICMISPGGVAQGIAGTYRIAGTNDSLTASNALFNLPSGLLWDNSKQSLVISDTDNDTIRRLYVTNSAYAVQTISGLAGIQGFVDGSLSTAEFFHPLGLSLDPFDTGYYVVDGGNNALRVLQPTQPPAAPQPIPNPVIGYVYFPIVNDAPSAQFVPITSPIAVFNNAVDLAIEQNDGSVDTYMSYGPTGSAITPPGTNTDFAAVFTAADDGLLPSQVPDLNIPIIPALTLEAISIAPGRPSSDAVSVQVQFVTANPNIIGDNAADIILSNTTVGAEMFYALDNSTNSPTNDGSYGIGPITSGTTLVLNITTNTTLKVRAFTAGFAPSQTVSEALSVASFVGNELTFGFASGVASTKFVTTGGRYFYAPVTISELPNTKMFSLQFDLTESGAVHPVNTNTWDFQSFLFVNNGPIITNGIVVSNGSLTNLIISNSLFVTTNDLMEVSWITSPPQSNLYPTTLQDLTEYSAVQGTLFLESQQQVAVGAYSFGVPIANTVGNTYTIQANLPSASTFAVQNEASPPIGVLIQVPTNGSLGAGSINSVKEVTVTNSVSYLVGDAYPFGWFNAGDFGDNDLQNDDVINVFQAALGYFTPPVNSDYFDAMDSGNGSINNLFDANDSDINGITTGDHQLLVDDVYVTLRRSLDTNLIWWIRTWSNGIVPPSYTAFTNFNTTAARPAASSNSSSGAPRYIAVAAGQVQSGGSLSVQVPVQVLAADPVYPIRVMMLSVEIDPLDGSPPITDAISFSTGDNLGSPTLALSQGDNNYGAAWLSSTVSGVSGTNLIGTLSVTLPSNVTSNSAYRVHFDHFSASPNGIALFNSSAQDGLITVGNRSASSWHDGIPDSWRLLWFGTVSNALSAATADPDGDGANNWQEYVAGTNPNDPTSVFKFLPGSTLAPSSFTMQWSSVPNKLYSVQTSYKISPGSWTTVATNILGSGQPVQWTDNNATGKTQFYRAIVQ
jgi:sugar lactone lactonase YvrE